MERQQLCRGCPCCWWLYIRTALTQADPAVAITSTPCTPAPPPCSWRTRRRIALTSHCWWASTISSSKASPAAMTGVGRVQTIGSIRLSTGRMIRAAVPQGTAATTPASCLRMLPDPARRGSRQRVPPCAKVGGVSCFCAYRAIQAAVTEQTNARPVNTRRASPRDGGDLFAGAQLTTWSA